jgi:hypothetical protein
LIVKAVMLRSSSVEHKAKLMVARSNAMCLISVLLKQGYVVEVSALDHGVLTYAILSGLGENGDPKAEENHEGFVTVEALVKYVKGLVPELTSKYKGGK